MTSLTITVDPSDPGEIDHAIELLNLLRLAPEEAASTPAADPPRSDGRGSPDTPREPSDSPQAAPSLPRRGATPASRVDAVAAEKARLERQGPARGRAGVTRERVLGYIREHPGCIAQELVTAIGVGKGSISAHLSKLGEQGRITHRRDGKLNRYTVTDEGLLPADGNGAKSEQERKIVELLIEAKTPLPATEISIRTGIRSDHVPSMCAALHRRRVIAQVPPKRQGLPTRWQPLKHTRTMSDRGR